MKTQKDCEEIIKRMRVDRNFRQNQSGMNDSNIEKSNPIFDYCRDWLSDVKTDNLDALDLRGFDFMHQCMLGLFVEIGMALATIVVERGKESQLFFHQNVVSFSLQHVKEFEMTIFRAKDNSLDISTNLLGLLKNGSLYYGREYQELFPFYGVLFVGVVPEFDDEFARNLMALISFASSLQSKYWPVNAEEKWWEDFRLFGVESYKSLYRSLCLANNGKPLPNLDVSAKKIKSHSLFCHDLLKIMKRGVGCGSQGLEAQFGIATKIATNGKDFGVQILQKMSDLRLSHLFLSSDSQDAKCVASLLDDSSSGKWSAGTEKTIKESLRLDVLKYLRENFGEEKARKFKVRFVKWVELEKTIDQGGAERGGVKIYATSEWHGRENFDIIEYGECGGKYLFLFGLCEVLNQEKTVVYRLGIGEKMQLIKGAPSSISLRMPLLRLVGKENIFESRKIKIIDIEEKKVEATQVVKILRPERLRNVTSEVFIGEEQKWPKFHASDTVFHHNIYVTYGRLQTQDFMRMFPINSKNFE